MVLGQMFGLCSALWDLLTCSKILRLGTAGFTSPPNAVALRIFIALKNQSLSAGSEPMNRRSNGKHETITSSRRTCIPLNISNYLSETVPGQCTEIIIVNTVPRHVFVSDLTRKIKVCGFIISTFHFLQDSCKHFRYE
jgi:hypothetical protein